MAKSAESETRRRGALLEHFVCRTAGVPVDCMEQLRAAEAADALREVAVIETEMEARRPALVESLFDHVGQLEDRRLRGLLLQIKRDIHNHRRIRAAVLEKVEESIPGDLLQALGVFRDLALRRQQAESEAKRTHRKEICQVRRRFQALIANEDFQKGILLSSRSLFRQIPRYRQAEASKLTKKDRQTERSLMRYYSRMAMKATPFGTFCAILAGHIEASPHLGSRPLAQADPAAKRSLVRLNKGICTRLVEHFCQRAETRRRFPVDLNPTLRQAEQELVFLASVEGREVFQRLPLNPALELILEVLAHKPQRTLAELAEALSLHPRLETSPPEAELFCGRLAEIGLLRFQSGIPEQEIDWEQPLARFLQELDDEQAAGAAQALIRLRRNAQAYSGADVRQRVRLLKNARQILEGLFDGLGLDLTPRQPFEAGKRVARIRLPFYEDAGAPGQVRLSRSAVGRLEGCLAEYVELTSRIASPAAMQANMRHFFEIFYGPEAEAVPLVAFYEDFFREHFKQHLERLQSRPAQLPLEGRRAEAGEAQAQQDEKGDPDYDLANPFQLESVGHMLAAQRRLARLIRKRWAEAPSQQEIRLSRQDLEQALRNVPKPGRKCRSVSLFAQYIPQWGEAAEPALFAHSYFPGFGKYFSRFLSLFPQDVQAQVLESNAGLSGDCLAEICGDAGFNANLHPPLLAWEISYPTGQSGFRQEQLLCTEIVVEPDPRDAHSLQLRHLPSGRRVVPVDLGFLNPRMRPPLFQLLTYFTTPSIFYPEIPERTDPPIEEAPAGKSSDDVAEGGMSQGRQAWFVVRPRLSYRGCILLARRRWQVASDRVPRRQASESESDYFVRLDGWRRRLGLPAQVYARADRLLMPSQAVEAPQGNGAEEKGSHRPSRRPASLDHFKPQFIDFENPLLVELFSRIGENLKHFSLVLEERLPDDEQLMECQGKKYVTEWVLQMDFPDRSL